MMINPETLQILNTIGIWLAGVGTLSAVIVSLYLARRDSKVQLKVSAGHRVLVTPGQKGTPDYCSIRVVNVGFRPATITGIGWRVGFFRKKYGIQTVHGHPVSSKLPIKLEHGDEANYLIGFLGDGSYPNWIDEFPKSFLPGNPKISSLTLRVQAYTSVGKTFESKIERGLRQRLVEFALKQKT
jgi:hypothetical protein